MLRSFIKKIFKNDRTFPKSKQEGKEFSKSKGTKVEKKHNRCCIDYIDMRSRAII